MKSPTQTKRIEYFDVLRVLSAIGVIIIHTTVLNWHEMKIRSFSWMFVTVIDCLFRWPVPIFLMISGALFLGSSRTSFSRIKRSLIRIVTAFLFWSALYSLVSYFADGISLEEAVRAFFIGPYHFWFLFAIIGLYLAVPILSKVVESDELTKYFLILALIFASLVPQLADIVGVVSDAGQVLIYDMLEQLDFTMASIYAFYFVAGCYLNRTEITPKWQKRIYILGILSTLATAVLTIGASIYKNTPWEFFMQNDSINVVISSIALFVYGKYHFSYSKLSEKAIAFLQALSKYSFGAILVHLLILEFLARNLHLDTLSFHPLLSVPVITALVFCVSFAISAALSHIPVLKKYIV